MDDTRAETDGSAALRAGAAALDRIAPDEDAALMLAYAAGDASAFNALYEKHERPVFRFLRRSLGADGESFADELHQEVWLAVVRNAAGYAPRARFTTWLYGIARSKLIDHWRARRPGTSLDAPLDGEAGDGDETLLDRLPAEPSAQPEMQALTRAQGAAFLRAVEQLPAPQREVFLLHAEGELTLAEIGALTGVGMETAKSRLRYALAKLRTTLEAWR
ncbi:MAG: sigma-70 family RNA polymerase sigma factor [Burkholderiaceae bacterium]|nr:sigma-70 family RNA polymerase sigma factor [Burkholderiaceae bacterium]